MSVSIRAAVATVSYKRVKAHPHHYTAAQKAKVRGEYIAAVGEKASFHLREAANIVRNWTKSLLQTMRHVCNPKTTKARDKGRSPKPVSFGGGGVASWDSTGGPSSRYHSNTSGQARTKKRNSSRISDSYYGVSLGGVASWNGTSSTSNQPQTNTKKGHTFDLSRIRNMTPVDIQALAILAGLLVGLLGGGPVGGFVTHGAVSSGLTSYSQGDKPINVAVNTAGGVLQGYFVGKSVKGLLTAARGVLARARGTLKPSPQSSKVYGPQPANAVDDVGDSVKGTESVDSGVKLKERIPKEVDDVVNYARNHNGAVQDGYKGNRVYNNIPKNPGDQRLPAGPISRV